MTSVCLSVCITQKLYIESGPYIHTRWGLPMAGCGSRVSRIASLFYKNILYLLHIKGDSTEDYTLKTGMLNGQNTGGQNPGGQNPGKIWPLEQKPRVDFQGEDRSPDFFTFTFHGIYSI